jgi:hypothetical protein
LALFGCRPPQYVDRPSIRQPKTCTTRDSRTAKNKHQGAPSAFACNGSGQFIRSPRRRAIATRGVAQIHAFWGCLQRAATHLPVASGFHLAARRHRLLCAACSHDPIASGRAQQNEASGPFGPPLSALGCRPQTRPRSHPPPKCSRRRDRSAAIATAAKGEELIAALPVRNIIRIGSGCGTSKLRSSGPEGTKVDVASFCL